ncbi:DUF6378 domain-containing protein [Pasteurella skyensis]|uniref:DUF6378 domain-containing protein n=1 Tax=Phocoenobacter skyensis TaxID=97481 RepID=A0AAJ6NBK8_9PAST|nr:DUF6378 domain-containing protein [Pasteurella skyensis]MDP8173661.1 DUF6378 domain-containing protein [Pasteurella skyensis]MDP8178029.1 DUF6378 domain-containing protein [Pasteurella skyensis]
MNNQTVQQTIKKRGEVYGDFCETAYISQKLKGALRYVISKNKHFIGDSQCEALEMICVKLARIATGNPSYEDNWRDIAGYAILGGDLEIELEEEQDQVVFKVGDKVYFPSVSNQIFSLSFSERIDYPLLIKELSQSFNEKGIFCEGDIGSAIFLATEKNHRLLSQLYPNIAFEKPFVQIS